MLHMQHDSVQAHRLLFTDNETNARRLYGQADAPGYFKDAFHDLVIASNKAAVNPQQTGTKAVAHYEVTVPNGGSASVRLRPRCSSGRESALSSSSGASQIKDQGRLRSAAPEAFKDFDKMLTQRRREADEFYAELQRDITDPDARNVQRQAFAGMIWSKQFFYYDVPAWIRGDANLMRIVLELARHNHTYEDIATKFFEHFLHIVEAMNNVGGEGIGLWDEPDQCYYDVLNLPDGAWSRSKCARWRDCSPALSSFSTSHLRHRSPA